MGWFSKIFGGKKHEGSTSLGSEMHMAAHSTAAGRTAKDPVCGMEVDVEKAAATSSYQGQTYYFCASGCKRAFDQDPAKYLTGEAEMHGRHMH